MTQNKHQLLRCCIRKALKRVKQTFLWPWKRFLVWGLTSENHAYSLHYTHSKSRYLDKPQNGLSSFWGQVKKQDGDTGTLHIPGCSPSPGVSTSLTWGQGLLQLLCLLFVCDDQGVQVPATSNFKLHIILIFLDLDRYQRPELTIKLDHRKESAQSPPAL